MTATDKAILAATAWAYITRADDPMPPLIARDWLMDHAECERDAAVKMLADAAAASLRFEVRKDTNWDYTPSSAIYEIRTMDLDEAASRLDNMRQAERETPDAGTRHWLAWCDRAGRAIAVLRELAAPDS